MQKYEKKTQKIVSFLAGFYQSFSNKTAEKKNNINVEKKTFLQLSLFSQQSLVILKKLKKNPKIKIVFLMRKINKKLLRCIFCGNLLEVSGQIYCGVEKK